MFSKKYIFESRTTKTQRVLGNILLLFSIILLFFLLLVTYIPFYAQSENEMATKVFYGRSPDVIAVYTGDSGRLDYTFKKADKHPSSKIFISGVYTKNSLETLLHKQGKDISVNEFISQESHHIELDYNAKNTIENGIATLNYLKSLNEHYNVLIVSSDYHIFRISIILKKLSGNKTNYRFYYESIPADYTQWRNIKMLFKEVLRIVKTSAILLFWD